MGFQHYATSGSQVVWDQGDRMMDSAAVVAELNSLGIKGDLVVWRRGGGYESVAMTLFYSPSGSRVIQHGYVNWQHIESMTEEEAGEIHDGMLETFARPRSGQ